MHSPAFHSFSYLRHIDLIPGKNSEFLEKLEELFSIWCGQIEQVLAESEQIRREADDTGPSAELLYWKNRMAKFHM